MATNRPMDGLGALGDGTRMAIFESLAERPRAVGELADALPISRPAVSQHLKVLKDAGLVTEHAEGTRRIYQLNPVGMAALRDQLDTFWNRALAGYQDVTDQPTRSSMTEQRPPVRKQIIVDAPIERAFAVFTERFGDFKPPEHNLLGVADRRDRLRAEGRRPHLRPRRGRQRVPLGPRPGLRPAEPGRVQLGHQPDLAARDRPRQRQRGRGPLRRRVTRPDARGAGAPQHRPARPRLGSASRDGVDGDQGWPLYLDRYAALLTD